MIIFPRPDQPMEPKKAPCRTDRSGTVCEKHDLERSIKGTAPGAVCEKHDLQRSIKGTAPARGSLRETRPGAVHQRHRSRQGQSARNRLCVRERSGVGCIRDVEML